MGDSVILSVDCRAVWRECLFDLGEYLTMAAAAKVASKLNVAMICQNL